jgi:hypothetical protein
VKLVDEDLVGLLQQLDFFRRDVTEDSNAETGTGKRMTLEDLFGIPRSRPMFRTSSLKSSLSGSINLRFIFSGSPPTVVMRLDRHRRTAE